MLDLVLQLVVVAVALVVVLAILQVALAQRYHFMIMIDRGKPRVSNGKVHAAFLDNIRAVCEEHGIISGWIGGVRQGKAIALRFSRNIPYGCQQRLRNIWFNS
jgi:hypothetical protein